MEQPTAQEIRTFLEVFNKLDAFNATMKHLRGYGVTECSFPIPEVITTVQWLEHLVNRPRCEPLPSLGVE